ncbi:replication initiation protein [Acinetobacter pittii]|uniref:replication initiation protein RepM n=1 Tax=Acinetobacter calcoaceticus/baumannii complex TaxID=909768 RepID=UPI000A32BE8D|nr:MULTISPECIES: replication initiation protein RepM [Acinetobacter calcoaceticus/baumannii complex]KAB8126052.1 replication initiation protein [Acinetobacter baumannii]MQQ85487.1 RepB family plasmid replication initiator protein [Acinetobacter baumannii]MQQ89391.1 RepB family plasmid replication initiator protein [Acinetobacter baumannii]MQR69944.1 RepB family plasmid replication initiator protein [Acinetobacter baumannii]MQR93529.1 RepB family plasmid replication initiator protein [Acinetoba
MRDLVVKDNALINASYNLDLVEQRLILLAIVEARDSGRGINANDPLEVHAESYVNQFNVARQTAYQALKDACKDLFVRQFSYQEINKRGNVENVLSRWVSEIRYIDDEATVKLIFAPAIVPLITRLEEQFTKYELQQISNLSSAYAVRLYELLIAWRSTGQTPIIELAEFRQKIGVLDDEYTRMGNFKDRVLNLAIAQINEHTDIKVQYQQHKKGRNIYGFSFTFKQKKVVIANNKKQTTLEIFSKFTDAQRHFFANKLSELPEMNKYSQGTESYSQFAVRISEMLKDLQKFEELLPYLEKVGFNAK